MALAGFIQVAVESFGSYWTYLIDEVTHPRLHSYFYGLIVVSLFFWLLEVTMPWRKTQPRIRKDFWLDGFYMFFNFFIFPLIGFAAVSAAVGHGFQAFLQRAFGVSNLVAVELGTWPIWAQLLLLFLVRDFVQWNIHRLLHRNAWLWRFHKVHHSVEQMGFAAHLRYHWMENVVYRLLEYVPLALIGFGVTDFFVVYTFGLVVGHFNHSNIRVPLGPLKYLLNNPQMHIWHHGAELRGRYGVNFGLTLSVWDYLFGTADVPCDGRDLELGFDDLQSFPKSFFRQQAFPLIR